MGEGRLAKGEHLSLSEALDVPFDDPELIAKVVVCIVADGRKAVNPRVLDCLAALGVYQEGEHPATLSS